MTSARLDQLQAEPVLATVRRLEQRIAARFPERGLLKVAGVLESLVSDVADDAADMHGKVRRARTASRALVLIILLGTLVALTLALRDARGDGGPDSSLDWLPLVETTINDLVFAAIAIYFLYSLPERLLRGHALDLLHRLRSLAHVIDMHQLTKDPERLRSSFTRTDVSIDPGLDRDQMEHYLDYCSELLSLVGKTAALCAEESRDSIVLDTVSTIELLTNDLSREIWQKISLLPK